MKQQLAVGEPWPYPLSHEGMGVVMDPVEDGLDVLISVTIARPSPVEVSALTERPLRIGLLPSPPLLWVLLAGDRISFDCPFAPGLVGQAIEPRHVAAAAKARTWSEQTRRLLTVGTADTTTGLCVGMRAMTLSRDWWIALADTIEAPAQSLTMRERDAAMQRDYARWTSTDAMLRAATILETAGRV